MNGLSGIFTSAQFFRVKEVEEVVQGVCENLKKYALYHKNTFGVISKTFKHLGEGGLALWKILETFKSDSLKQYLSVSDDQRMLLRLEQE